MAARTWSDVISSCQAFYGWTIAAMCIISKLAKVQGQANLIAFMVPPFQKDLRLTDGELGSLFSIATILSSTVQPYFGRAVDFLGARICMSITHAALALTLLGFSAAAYMPESILVYGQVIMFFFLLRALCVGALETFPNACLQRWFVRRRGRVVTIVAASLRLGLTFTFILVAWLVREYSWRGAACAGAILNIFMAPLLALLLRSSPEDCGLLPDGDGKSEKAPALACACPEDNAAELKTRLILHKSPTTHLAFEKSPPDLWLFYIFSFFIGIPWAGTDLYIVEIVLENVGVEGQIDIPVQMVGPSAFLAGILGPLFGEVMDRFQSAALSYFLVGFGGVLEAMATILLCFVSTPIEAVAFAILKGLNISIVFSLLNSGLVFAVLGVTSDRIGSVLGKNQFAFMAGTGIGPLLFGITHDACGTFRFALISASLPLLLLSSVFASRGYRAWAVSRETLHMVMPTDNAVLPADVANDALSELPSEDPELPVGFTLAAP